MGRSIVRNQELKRLNSFHLLFLALEPQLGHLFERFFNLLQGTPHVDHPYFAYRLLHTRNLRHEQETRCGCSLVFPSHTQDENSGGWVPVFY